MKDMTDQEFVEMIVKAIVDNPGDVKTERVVDDKGVLISLMVNEADMGKIIGKGGRTVNSIRKLLHVLGAKSDERVNLKIFEPGGGEVSVPSENGEAPVQEHHEEPMEHVNSEDVPKEEPVAEETPEPTPAPAAKKSDRMDDVDTEVLV